MRELHRDGVKLSQLRALVAVVDQGNFSEAALHLMVSQSAISHAIATLEDELGVVLLSRGRHGARLTPVGEQVIGHARNVLHSLALMGREANMAKGLHGGQLRIASFRSVATHVLPAAIAQFRRNFPGISVTITEFKDASELEQALREGRADIGFTHMPAAAGFETWELMHDEYLALMPPHSHVAGEPLTWEQLADMPLIMPPESDTCCAIIRNHLDKVGLPFNLAYEVREDSTMVSMVSQGLGTAIMARLAAEPLPPDIQVCPLPDHLERVIGAIILADALHPPPVFAFLDTLKTRALEALA